MYTDAESSSPYMAGFSYMTAPHLGKLAEEGSQETRVLKILTKREIVSQ